MSGCHDNVSDGNGSGYHNCDGCHGSGDRGYVSGYYGCMSWMYKCSL